MTVCSGWAGRILQRLLPEGKGTVAFPLGIIQIIIQTEIVKIVIVVIVIIIRIMTVSITVAAVAIILIVLLHERYIGAVSHQNHNENNQTDHRSGNGKPQTKACLRIHPASFSGKDGKDDAQGTENVGKSAAYQEKGDDSHYQGCSGKSGRCPEGRLIVLTAVIVIPLKSIALMIRRCTVAAGIPILRASIAAAVWVGIGTVSVSGISRLRRTIIRLSRLRKTIIRLPCLRRAVIRLARRRRAVIRLASLRRTESRVLGRTICASVCMMRSGFRIPACAVRIV